MSWEGCDDGQGSPYPLATFGLLAGSWTNISIPASPGNPGYLGAMAFDEAAGFLIGVTWSPRSGPCGSVGLTTWKFQDEVWSVLPTVHAPQARFSESMAYDPALGVVVLFGGVTWCGAVTNETWAFNGTDWANVTSMSGGGLPPPLQGASMAYDGRDAAMILFGGISGWSCPTCRPSNATWQLVDWNWSQVNTSGAAVPPARCDGSMVYDSSSDEIVLMGASSYGCYPDLEDMWAYSGGVWTNETPTAGFPLGAYAPRLADDPALGSVIAFVGWGGTDCSTPGYCSETWSFRDDSWTDLGPLFPVAPDPREFAVMAYDVADATVVLQGGISNLGVEGGADMWDTWILSVAGLPGPPVIGAFVADSPASEVGKTVHFSLLTSGGDGTLNFDYTGIPPGCASTNTPLLVCYLTTSGTFNVTAIATDVLGRSARANMELRVAAHLQIDRFQAVPSSISLGGSSTLSASISGGLAPTIVSYLSLPPGCASANTTDLSCTPDASGAFQISLLVQDSIGIFAFASTFLNVTSVPLPTPLSIESFVVEPAVVSVNQSVQFTVAIWGGTAPATPSYSGLPPGCLNSQAMTFTCHPKVPGVYLVKLAVSDAAGTNASASTLLTVLAPVQPLTILAFVASPNPWSDGQTVLFQAITSGGTLPLSYFYGGLPEGCVGVDTARLTCSPVCPHASTNVTIAVVDATGAKATSSLTLFWASAAATENGSGPSFPAFAPIYWVVGAGFGAAIGAGIALAVVRKKADSDK